MANKDSLWVDYLLSKLANRECITPSNTHVTMSLVEIIFKGTGAHLFQYLEGTVLVTCLDAKYA